MSLYELIVLSQSVSDRVDVQWGFFITMHLALFGGIVYVDRPLKLPEKLVAIFLYSGFTIISYVMVNNQISLFIFTLQDIVSVAANHPDLATFDYYENYVQSIFYKYLKSIAAITHVIMFIIVLVSIILDTEKEDVEAPPDPQQSPESGPSREVG